MFSCNYLRCWPTSLIALTGVVMVLGVIGSVADETPAHAVADVS